MYEKISFKTQKLGKIQGNTTKFWESLRDNEDFVRISLELEENDITIKWFAKDKNLENI